MSVTSYSHHLSYLLTGMMSLCTTIVGLLLFLIVSPLLHSQLYIHAASTSSPITRHRIIFMTSLDSDDDYGDDYRDEDKPTTDIVSAKRITVVHTQPCKYNPCLENQEPCNKLAQQTGCLCPGFSGADVPPLPPRLQTLLPVSHGENRGKIEVKWCAPPSFVSHYRVTMEGNNGDALQFKSALRQGFIGSLEVGTRVCVEAVNGAGNSAFSEVSCQRYDPPNSSEHNLLGWILGGGVVLLLLIVVTSVILWKKKGCGRAKRDSTDGLGNPSYSTEGTL